MKRVLRWGLIAATGLSLLMAYPTYAAEFNLFGSSPGPSQNSDNKAVNVATRFRYSNTGGTVVGIRFWMPTDTGSYGPPTTGYSAYLWSADSTKPAAPLLAQKNFGTIILGAWNEVRFDTPVAITQNTDYYAAVYFPAGRYGTEANKFTLAGVTSGSLTSPCVCGGSILNGAYVYGVAGAMPDKAFNDTWYGIDAIVSDGQSVDPPPEETAGKPHSYGQLSASVPAYITLSSSGSVTANITPSGSGAMSSSADTITISTNNPAGYTLKLSNNDANTSLTSGVSNIAASSGNQASPAALVVNTWGYRVDGLAGFGVGPTSAETNVANSAYTWAGVPALASPHTIRVTNGTATSEQTKIWYGVKLNTSLPFGTYSDQVVYTAVTN